MKLSKEQIAVLAKTLENPWGSVKLVCDGYNITLEVARCKGMTYRVMTYVNGFFKGSWCIPKNEAPESKFMRKRVQPRCSPARKREAEKFMGKKYVKNNPYYSETTTSYMPDWSSGKAALNHLNKVCESIKLAE